MGARTANFCIDCENPGKLASWWAQVIDDFVPREQDRWTHDEAWLDGPAGRNLIFLKVPETKRVKNRMHLCIRPVGIPRDEEVDRLLSLGAALVHDLRDTDRGWAVLADPEGNEFCVLTDDADSAGVRRQ